jgi:HAMP domain-containing protein
LLLALLDVVDDGLREEISALQEAVNTLVASITRHR